MSLRAIYGKCFFCGAEVTNGQPLNWTDGHRHVHGSCAWARMVQDWFAQWEADNDE